MTELALIFVIFAQFGYIVYREFLVNKQITFLSKLLTGSPNPDGSTPLNPPNPATQSQDPNDIPLTEDHPFILPKEFNLEIEGQEPRPVKLE